MESRQSADVSIDMDSVTRNHHHVQLMEQQVSAIIDSGCIVCCCLTFLCLVLSQDTYIQERADAMENINSTIVELGQIFRQLAEMVHEQEEHVLRLVSSIQYLFYR